VEALDDDNFPSRAPRAYRLPYNARLAEKAAVAPLGSAGSWSAVAWAASACAPVSDYAFEQPMPLDLFRAPKGA